MTYNLDISLIGERTDHTYFTKKIFVASCQREAENIKVVSEILEHSIIDQELKEKVLKVIKRSQKLYLDMIYSAGAGQLLFTNQEKGEDDD